MRPGLNTIYSRAEDAVWSDDLAIERREYSKLFAVSPVCDLWQLSLETSAAAGLEVRLTN